MLAPLVARGVEDEFGFGFAVGLEAPVVEEELAETGALDALQKLLGNDLVGIDVHAIERDDDPVCCETVPLAVLPVAHVGEVAGDGGGGGHCGADEMRASVASLAAFEIAIAGGGATLTRLEHVGIHARHIEQPDSRHSKPASLKISSQSFFFSLLL